MAGVRATVIAGLGITVMGQSEVTEGMRVIGGELQLPPLRPAAIMLYYRSQDFDEAAQSLAVHLRPAALARQPTTASTNRSAAAMASAVK